MYQFLNIETQVYVAQLHGVDKSAHVRSHVFVYFMCVSADGLCKPV